MSSETYRALSPEVLDALYDRPVPSTRSGPLFNAHSYPTKINVAAVVPFIVTHTRPGDLIFDGFAGSGVTGLAASLLVARYMGNPILPAVFHFLGAVLMIGAIIKSGVAAARRGGLLWRGTFYPKEKLLEAQRLRGVLDRG